MHSPGNQQQWMHLFLKEWGIFSSFLRKKINKCVYRKLGGKPKPCLHLCSACSEARTDFSSAANCKFWSSAALYNLEIIWYTLITCNAETVIPEFMAAQTTLIISQKLPGIHLWSRCQKCTYANKFPLQFCWRDILLQLSVLHTTITSVVLLSTEEAAELRCWEQQFWVLRAGPVSLEGSGNVVLALRGSRTQTLFHKH